MRIRQIVSDSGLLCMLQGVLALFAVALLAFAPPAEGKMIVLPLTPGSADGLMSELYTRGSKPLDGGPLPGSVIVAGERESLFLDMLKAGRLVIAAPPAACGA